jgi:hypothetical protein
MLMENEQAVGHPESGAAPRPIGWLQLGLVFVGVWLGLLGAAIVLEKIFNSDSMAGSGGMTPLPVFFLGALWLGWIPALLITYVVGSRSARLRTPRHSGTTSPST